MYGYALFLFLSFIKSHYESFLMACTHSPIGVARTGPGNFTHALQSNAIFLIIGKIAAFISVIFRHLLGFPVLRFHEQRYPVARL